MDHLRESTGFTLIELSISIVIIGLIVAGVVAGQSLVRQAQIRTLTTGFSKYNTAINTFRLKYDAMPGDITNAWDYWGRTCGTNARVQDSVTGCNGNGDREVLYNTATDNAATENLRFWQHLALANLIPGTYTGIKTVDDYADINVNVPGSALSNSGRRIQTATVWGATGIYDRTDDYLSLASPTVAGDSTYLNGAVISAQEAKNLDKKTDDGAAETGNITGLNAYTSSWQTGCVTTASGNTNKPATYILDSATSEQINCRLVFYGTF